jgi:hypothetical protein
MSSSQQGIGRVGLVGTILALLGCLGFPAVLGLLSVIGARWLLDPRYLLPILALGIACGLWSLFASFRRDPRPLPIVLGLVGGIAALATEIVRALTHQHAYFLGYPGLVLFAAAFVILLVQHGKSSRRA